MDYSGFDVSPPVVILGVMAGIVMGVITLMLVKRRKGLRASIVGFASVLVIAVWIIANGMVETARTNELLAVADEFAVPSSFSPGKAERFRGERVTRATAATPCMAVTSHCPSLHKQWSAPEGHVMTREEFEVILRDSGWQGKLAIEEKHCGFVHTNSNIVSCTAKGVVGAFDTMVYVTQTKGDPWELHLDMELAQQR